jgi:hypothetical protein
MAHVLAHMRAAVQASDVPQHGMLSAQGPPALAQHWVPLPTHCWSGPQHCGVVPHATHPLLGIASFCPPPACASCVPASALAPSLEWPSTTCASAAAIPAVTSALLPESGQVFHPHVRSLSTPHPASIPESAATHQTRTRGIADHLEVQRARAQRKPATNEASDDACRTVIVLIT